MAKTRWPFGSFECYRVNGLLPISSNTWLPGYVQIFFCCDFIIDYVLSSYWTAGLHSVVGSGFDCRFRVHKFKSHPSHITFMAIGHEIFFTAILPFLLIQEGLLSVTGGRFVGLVSVDFLGNKNPGTDW